jgi:outer membrane protein assembly factor BamA
MRLRISAALLLAAVTAPTAAAQDRQREPQSAGTPIFREPAAMTKGFNFAEKYFKESDGQRKAGWYPVFKTNVTGDGWISAGSGYRLPLFERRAWFDGSAAVSWRGYKTAQATFEVPDIRSSRVGLGTQLLWQDLTQIQYFGAGPGTSRDMRSDYRLKNTDVIGFATYRPADALTLEGRDIEPTLSSSAGPFDRGYPDAMTIFPSEPGFDPDRQPPFVHAQLSATADTREHPGHPRSGGVYRAAWSAYSDRDTGRFSFRRYELEGVHFVPLSPVRWTLAFHGWSVLSDTNTGHDIPAYLLPSLGGSTTLRSYSDYRFHDRHLLLVSAESRWALFEHIDGAVFGDAGSVAPRFRELTLENVSYGAGLRVHIRSSTVARIDVAHGGEGWRLLMRLNEPFRLNRLSRRTAAIPFVP